MKHSNSLPSAARKRAALISGAAVVGMLLAVSPSAAWANAYWQVLSHGTAITGVGTTTSANYVTNIEVRHDHGLAAENVCNFQVRASGTLATGSAFARTYGYTAGCVFHGFAKGTQPNLYFKVGSTISGQAYDGGAWAPGVAQVTV